MNEEKVGGSSELKPLIDAIDSHLLRLTTKSVYREDIKQRILKATAQAIDREFDEIFAKLKPANEAIHKLKHSGKNQQPTNQVEQLLCCPDCLAWFDKEYLDGFRLQGNENWIECPHCSVGTRDWKAGAVIC